MCIAPRRRFPFASCLNFEMEQVIHTLNIKPCCLSYHYTVKTTEPQVHVVHLLKKKLVIDSNHPFHLCNYSEIALHSDYIKHAVISRESI